MFHLVCRPDPNDKKTNITLVTSIKREGSTDTFIFPIDLQPLRMHKELTKSLTIAVVSRNLTQRHKYGNIALTATKELLDAYYDQDGNARFGHDYLEGLTSSQITETQAEAGDQNTKHRSLQSVTKDAVIVNFNGSKPNATTWIANFERECDRLQITPQNRYVALRLFLEGIACEWYRTTYTLIGTATRAEWKLTFCD